MSNSLRRVVLSALALCAALASAHCERAADTPLATTGGCCELTPNAALREGIGRIVVGYPSDGASSTRIEVLARGEAGKRVGEDYGDVSFELEPGTYDLTLGGRHVRGVAVRAGHDTRIRVGVLHVHATQGTAVELIDHADGERVASGYGETQYGLPVGPVTVEVTGQRDTAQIEDGKVTDLRFGRLVVAYPEKVSAPIEVFRAGETQRLADGYGDRAVDLFPGKYDVTISGKHVAGLTVSSGNDTPIEVGVLRVNASDGTHVEVVDPIGKQVVVDGYGTVAFGLPIGEIGVRIAGQTETVVIEAGQITEF
jgi:hypothetical protein